MRHLRAVSSVTWAILALCVGIEAVLQAADRGLIDVPRLRLTAYEYGGFWPGLLDDWGPNYPGQPVTMFLTYGFLHGGGVHLVVNMMTLMSLGAAVAARVGAARYAVIYAFSVLGGALGYGLLASGLIPMVGASGALFGLAGAILAWEFRDRRDFGESLAPVWRMTGILVALNLLLWWAMDGHLAWQTHLGGFIAGVLAGYALDVPLNRTD